MRWKHKGGKQDSNQELNKKQYKDLGTLVIILIFKLV